MSIEMIRMSKRNVTRLFVGAIVAVGLGLALGIAALWAALASDAIEVGGSHVVDLNGGSGAWTALGLVLVGSLATAGRHRGGRDVLGRGTPQHVAARRQGVVRVTARARAARLRRRRDDRLRRRRPGRHESERGTSGARRSCPHLKMAPLASAVSTARAHRTGPATQSPFGVAASFIQVTGDSIASQTAAAPRVYQWCRP
jgi:hypothetical protein